MEGHILTNVELMGRFSHYLRLEFIGNPAADLPYGHDVTNARGFTKKCVIIVPVRDWLYTF